VIDLEGMIRAGCCERRLPITVRCRERGGEGQLRVRLLERMLRLIHEWKLWQRSTGPRTTQGKAKVSRNAWRGGFRTAVRRLARMRRQEKTPARGQGHSSEPLRGLMVGPRGNRLAFPVRTSYIPLA
jgi:hypothetical protein